MKKPNIIENDWIYNEQDKEPYNIETINGTFDAVVCSVYNRNGSNVHDTCKAISAVPEMIEALIYAESLVALNLPETSNERQKIRKALRKAGVEL